jgi:hypothetical protein
VQAVIADASERLHAVIADAADRLQATADSSAPSSAPGSGSVAAAPPGAESAAAANAPAAAGDNEGQSDTNVAQASASPPAEAEPSPHFTVTPSGKVTEANPFAAIPHENELQPAGPPAGLAGAKYVANTSDVLGMVRIHDMGGGPVYLIDARGCTQEPTIPRSMCLKSNSIAELEAKAPVKERSQLVFFCHDDTCPTPFTLASDANAAGYAYVWWYRGGVTEWVASGEPTVIRSGDDGHRQCALGADYSTRTDPPPECRALQK